MLKIKARSMCLRTIFLFALLIAASGPIAAKQVIYTNESCPVTFVVPSDLELHDVIGWTDPSDKIACRISVVRKGYKHEVAPLEKSFDDVRDLSDIVLAVRFIPIRSRLSDLNFTFIDGHVLYKGETLFPGARAMGYEVLKIRPIDYYPVGHGDMYVGTQDFIERHNKKDRPRRSESYVFLLGNSNYSIDIEITYDKNRYNNKIKKNSLLRLLRSANFHTLKEFRKPISP